MLMYAVPMFSMYDAILFVLCLVLGAVTVYIVAKIYYWIGIWKRKRVYDRANLAADRQKRP